jgi:hypothetical protein
MDAMKVPQPLHSSLAPPLTAHAPIQLQGLHEMKSTRRRGEVYVSYTRKKTAEL